jgi:hypothetical protein
MTTNTTPSNPITMKINREASTLELQWDRKSKNIEYILSNIKIFEIEITSNITKQIINLSTAGGKKRNTDIICI